MKDCTIISYPGSNASSLLSLTEGTSQYMLPFGGRFRVIDFTLRNSFSSGARRTIIYNNVDDDLHKYVSLYGPFDDAKFPPVKVVSKNYTDIKIFYDMILDSNTRHYIIYNGDNPSIIDFDRIMDRYKTKKSKSVLFQLKINNKASMAYKVLVSDQKTLLKIINKAIKDKHESPNIFEMIINAMINRGIIKSSISAHYWPIKSVPEYYNLNREVIWNPEISNLLYNEKIIKSQINAEGYARIGFDGIAKNSFISDFCTIHGKVENSIIYPGVTIGKNTTVKDSIILPYVKIGEGSRITRAIVDERRDLDPESDYLNVGTNCIIGSSEEHIKNDKFPKALFSSVSLIGKDCRIAEGARIGGGCYVASEMGEEFLKKKFLYDGESLIRQVKSKTV